MKFFTSDWHLGDDRLGVNGKPNLFYRPFSSVSEQDVTIFENFINSSFKDGDDLWHLGDVGLDVGNIEYWFGILRKEYPNSKFNLIIGNYDEDKLEVLGKYFDSIQEWSELNIGEYNVFLNHYPITCQTHLKEFNSWDFAITGHIHGLWKVQKNMINVGVDAWHFRPVSETEILFCWNAMQKFYDENVFLPCK